MFPAVYSPVWNPHVFPQSVAYPLTANVSLPHSESDIRQLWLQLRKDEPHLLSSFEDLLNTIFAQLQEAHEQKNELECTLRK